MKVNVKRVDTRWEERGEQKEKQTGLKKQQQEVEKR